ncbi:MAG: hypothetical protein SVW57_15120 [Thermodesulfobacteriota bacterium]|nr:hypothetical protein [Thermodesulfobacteriota bacterium]
MKMNEYEFNEQFQRLCKRWGKKGNDDQAEIYFEFVHNFDYRRLKKAVTNIMSSHKYFPTPEELQREYYSIKQANKINDNCDYCDSGVMRFTIKGKEYASPCAHCRKRSVVPLVGRVGDAVYYAFKKSSETTQYGDIIYNANLIEMEKIEGARACK